MSRNRFFLITTTRLAYTKLYAQAQLIGSCIHVCVAYREGCPGCWQNFQWLWRHKLSQEMEIHVYMYAQNEVNISSTSQLSRSSRLSPGSKCRYIVFTSYNWACIDLHLSLCGRWNSLVYTWWLSDVHAHHFFVGACASSWYPSCGWAWVWG